MSVVGAARSRGGRTASPRERINVVRAVPDVLWPSWTLTTRQVHAQFVAREVIATGVGP